MRAMMIAAIGAGVATLALTGCGGGGSKSAARTPAVFTETADVPVVNVAGRGEVKGTPDTATVTMGIETRDKSAQTALDNNNAKAAELIKTLKDRGVAEADIQTSNLSVNPNWDLKGKITDYVVSNTVTVELHDIKGAGATIDAAASAAGDDIRIHGVMFSIDDTSELIAKARAEAVKDAMAQAQQLSDAAGVKLGAIRKIDNTGSELPQPNYFSYDRGMATAAETIPIEPGTQELSVSVNVEFAIAG